MATKMMDGIQLIQTQEAVAQSVKVAKSVKNNSETLLNISAAVEEVYNKNEIILANNINEVVPPKFGVLGHIDPMRNLLSDAMLNIKNLRDYLVQYDKNGSIAETSFINRAQKLLDQIKADFNDELGTLEQIDWKAKFDKKNLNLIEIAIDDVPTNNLKLKSIGDIGSQLDSKTNKSSLYSSGLFSAGTSIRNDIRDLDNLQNSLVEMQAKLGRLQTRKNNEVTKLNAEIPEAQRQLSNLNQQRLQALADYQVAKNLVEENWRNVEAAYLRREKILTHHRGIYYARVSETPYGLAPLADLPLMYGKIDDLVPGIALDHKELPEDIEPFINAVVEVPIANWTFFNNHWDLLPSRDTLLKILAKRKVRMDFLSKVTPIIGSTQFKSLLSSHQSIVNDFARVNFIAEISLQAFNRQVVQLVSLEDLLGGTPHALRGQVQEFRNRIDQATHSLITHLKNIRPSLRLEWAKSAELDQLDLKNPQSWPELGEAQADDLDGIRTFVALVHWWWRQLNEDASSASVTAVRNLLRAILLVAAGDDPDEILHGRLQVVPASFRLGDFLRVDLNRHAPIGTVLQLMNEKDELVGRLRVEDADDKGSVVSVMNVYTANSPSTGQNISSQYSVVGMKTSARSFA